jgi:hypothetical protein
VRTSDIVSQMVLLELKGRIANLETFVKTTAKMTLVQAKLLVQKIGLKKKKKKKDVQRRKMSEKSRIEYSVVESRPLGELKVVEWCDHPLIR